MGEETRKIQKKKSKASETCKCKVCKKVKDKRQFYTGSEYCKACIKSIATNNDKEIYQEGVEKVMEMLDKPFVYDVFVRVAQQDKTTVDNFVGEYIRQINVDRNYKDGTYKDSVLYNKRNEEVAKVKSQIIKDVEAVKEEEKTVDNNMRFFWTKGLSNIPDKEILILQKMYDQYTNNDDPAIVTSKKTQDDFKTLCILELQKSKIQFNLEEVKSCQTLQKMIDDLSISLGIQNIQKQSEFDASKFTVGLVCRYAEDIKKRPIPRFVKDLGGICGINPIRESNSIDFIAGMGESVGISTPRIEEAKAKLKEFEVKVEEIYANGEQIEDEEE